MIDVLHYAPHGAIATLIAIIWWFVRRAGSNFMDEIRSAKSKLETIEQTTRVQAENHLKTIQEESKKQTQILESLDRNISIIADRTREL